MDEVDQQTCVLEPDHPLRRDCFRRIALGNHCAINITVDPRAPRAYPICKFMGAESFLAPLKTLLNSHSYSWDNNKSIAENLRTILNIELPSPLTNTKEDFKEDCGICYNYKLGEGEQAKVPDMVCDYTKCSRPFHKTCLFDWLKSLTSSHQSFDTIFGSCPYCSSPISVAL
eukprot:TRINITY_DN7857_c0_g1_i1.p2 TRINITY_DN7857_c0_g1~~TRINITY_DN7857_c0_g1_i1.p2  ORF type:complete len:172 (-),score=44.07 TRINITY_DN7857_c0_g1_i1:102-617(-)